MIESQPRFPRSSVPTAPFANSTDHGRPSGPTVQVPAGEVFRVLAHAMMSERQWLHDFQDDLIALPYDLYEVLQAYRDCERLSA